MAKHFPIKTLVDLAQDDLDAATKQLGRVQRERADIETQLADLIRYRDEYHASFSNSAQAGMPAGIGRPGLPCDAGSKRGSSEMRRWQVWQSKK